MTRDWPQRSWGLAALGGLVGWLVHRLLPPSGYPYGAGFEPTAAELSLSSFLIVAGLVFAYVVERGRITGSIVFALLTGLVIASVLQQAGDGGMESVEVWRLVSALVAVALAAPLFQAWRERPAGQRLPAYAGAHDHAWTNLVLWCASFVFLGLVWLLAWLLGALFELIGIDTLQKLLRQRSIGFALSGAALGAGIGLLRDRTTLLATLRHVISTVLSVLAPVLAAGVALFLIALPFTGLAPLWQATRATTPIMLSVMVGALGLIIIILGDSDADMAKSRLLRGAAVVLAAVLLPLAGIAALSVNLRILQHGLTPDRLWAIVFVGIATAYALIAAFALLRRLPRLAGWAERFRAGTLLLALGLCALLVLLSTPLIDFGAIATRDQLARLQSGIVSPQDFDWAALRFDFGPSGVAALKQLEQGKLAPAEARLALAADNRWDLGRDREARQNREEGRVITATIPRGTPVPPALQAAIDRDQVCSFPGACIIWMETPDRARVFNPNLGESDYAGGTLFDRGPRDWTQHQPSGRSLSAEETERRTEAMRAALQRGDVSIRTVERQQLFIGDTPVGSPLDPADAAER